MKSQLLFLIVFASLVVSKNLYPCTTPNNEKSYCTSLFSCPRLMTLIGSLDPSAIEFVKNSLCFSCSSDDVMVCCGSSRNNFSSQKLNGTDIIVKSKILKIVRVKRNVKSTIPTKTKVVRTESHKGYPKRARLPSKRYCGYQHTDAVFDDEYPWLVSIVESLRPGNDVGNSCTGVLISNRYVLTQSTCAHRALKVKLGQYNTHENKSCFGSSDFEECTDQPIEIRVEEKIKEGEPWSEPYNFALLRLAEPVYFSDFIRPICLPLEEDKRPIKSIVFFGCGTKNETAVVKKILLVDDEICYEHADHLRDIVKRTQISLICAVTQKNNTNVGCGGNTGVPFVYSRKHQWFVGGSIVDDVYSCDNTAPVVGIRITRKTINWILSSIRP